VAVDITILRIRKAGSGVKVQRLALGVARTLASLLREIFGRVILVISGRRRMMYQSLGPKAGGDNLSQEVKASAGKLELLTTLPPL
jgi:hypothetical protein